MNKEERIEMLKDLAFSEAMDDTYILEIYDNYLLDEEVKYELFGHLKRIKDFAKQHEEVRAIYGQIKEINEFISEKEGKVIEQPEGVWETVKSIFRFLYDLQSWLLTPFLILIFPIIYLAISRLIRYFIDTDDFTKAQNCSYQAIAELNKLKKKVDEKDKKKIDTMIAKLKKSSNI